MDIDFEKIAQTLEQYRDTYSRTLDAARNKDAETTREGLAALFDVFGAMLDVIDLEGKPKPYTGGEDGAL